MANDGLADSADGLAATPSVGIDLPVAGNHGAPGFPGASSLSWSDIIGALTTQARVINAMMMRETLSRYGEHKMGFIWAMLEPIFMVTLLVGIMSVLRADSPGGMPVVPFMVSGFVPFILFRNTMNQMKKAIGANRALLGFPQVTTFDVIVARALLELCVMLCVFAFMLTMVHLLGYEVRIENPLGVLAVCLCLWALGSGLGFVFAALTPVVPSISQFSSLLLGRPLLLTSGLFYTAGSLPEPVRTWLLYNPVLHFMELLRSYFFYEFESIHGSWHYAGSWAFGSLVLGLLTHQALRRRAIVGL